MIRDSLAPMAWALHVVRLFGLVITCGVAMAWVASRFSRDTALAVVAVAAICAHLPMLVVFNTRDRYAMLAWDLTMFVLIVWLARLVNPRMLRDAR